MTTAIRCVVVDDEELARDRLRDLLTRANGIQQVGEAVDGLGAVRCIDELRPDLVFLDVRLPGISGLQVLERVKHVPAIIFTTAFDQFAPVLGGEQFLVRRPLRAGGADTGPVHVIVNWPDLLGVPAAGR